MTSSVTTGHLVTSPQTPGRGRVQGQLGTALVLVAVWAVLVLGTGMMKPFFLGTNTFTAISYSAAILLPTCVGIAVVTISGGALDLSGGVIAGGASLMCASLLGDGWSTGTVVATVLTVGALLGVVNAGLITWVRLDPIVVTLATSFVGTGVMQMQALILTMPADSGLRSFGFSRPLGVTNLIWVGVALLLAVDLFLRRTRPGRHVVALGGNALAATRQGISRGRIRFFAFVFSGACAALSGILIAASSDIVQPAPSPTMQFQAVSAVLLAGIMLAGGRGRLIALLASVLVIVTIPTCVTTLGLSSAWGMVVQGFVLGIALALDGARAHRSVAS